MSYKPLSNLLEKIRGGGGVPPLSESEFALLTFVLDSFGEALGSFFLSGLGEESNTPGWLFTITFSDGLGRRCRREVRVQADYRPDLAPSVPRHKEPLVALALLWLLVVDRKPPLSSLSYSQDEVLGLLGWEDTQASRLNIDEAVKRYFTLLYEWGLGEQELAESNLSFFHGEARFISGYWYQSVEEDGEVRHTANEVNFDEEFIKELIGRSLFGVDWDRVSSVERVPREERGDDKVRC
jgi:hypothetical protein